jgi:peroxiredoxin
MPKLQELYQRRQGDGLMVIGVSQDTLAPAALADHVATLGVTYPILTPGEKIGKEWGGIGILPTSFLVDRSGIVVRRYVGGSEAVVAAMLADVEAHLDGKPLGNPVVPPPAQRP